jgi:hypothetical protein
MASTARFEALADGRWGVGTGRAPGRLSASWRTASSECSGRRPCAGGCRLDGRTSLERHLRRRSSGQRQSRDTTRVRRRGRALPPASRAVARRPLRPRQDGEQNV